MTFFNEKIYDVLDVGRFIINYSNKQKYDIPYLKLEKILFFVQGYYLAETCRPLFKEDILVSRYGPIVEKIRKEFGTWGLSIPYIKDYVGPINSNFPMSVWNMTRYKYKTEINDEDQAFIENIVDTLSRFSSADLLEEIYKFDFWKKIYKEGQGIGSVISRKNLMSYFYELLQVQSFVSVIKNQKDILPDSPGM